MKLFKKRKNKESNIHQKQKSIDNPIENNLISNEVNEIVCESDQLSSLSGNILF